MAIIIAKQPVSRREFRFIHPIRKQKDQHEVTDTQNAQAKNGCPEKLPDIPLDPQLDDHTAAYDRSACDKHPPYLSAIQKCADSTGEYERRQRQEHTGYIPLIKVYESCDHQGEKSPAIKNYPNDRREILDSWRLKAREKQKHQQRERDLNISFDFQNDGLLYFPVIQHRAVHWSLQTYFPGSLNTRFKTR